MCMSVIINKALSVENHDERGVLNGCISCRFGKAEVILNLVKTLCHPFVLSQPCIKEKGSLVNHAKKKKKEQQKYHGFHLSNGLKFYILAEHPSLFNIYVCQYTIGELELLLLF